MPFCSTRNLPLLARCLGFALAVFALPLDLAQAQQAAPKPAAAPPVSAEPSATTASFGDWVLRCQRLAADKPERACEVSQTMQVQGQSAPVAQFAIGRIGKGAQLRATAVVLPNLSFPSSLLVSVEKDPSSLELTWRRCLPGGCVADLAVSDDQLKRWRTTSERGRLTFKDAAGREIAIPLSFQGLGPALDALAKEAL